MSEYCDNSKDLGRDLHKARMVAVAIDRCKRLQAGLVGCCHVSNAARFDFSRHIANVRLWADGKWTKEKYEAHRVATDHFGELAGLAKDLEEMVESTSPAYDAGELIEAADRLEERLVGKRRFPWAEVAEATVQGAGLAILSFMAVQVLILAGKGVKAAAPHIARALFRRG